MSIRDIVVYSGITIVLLVLIASFAYRKKERSKQLPNTTRLRASIEIGLCYWNLILHLPSAIFIQNMKRSVKSSADSLRNVWTNDKSVFLKIYPTIPMDMRKRFIKVLMEELRESIESYFEKDEFYISILSSFMPMDLADDSKIDALFTDIFAITQKYEPIEVLSIKQIDELDAKNGEETEKDTPDSIKMKAQTKEFLQTVRALAAVQFLHQFLKRYPVDPTDGGYANSFVYMLLGEKSQRVVEAAKKSFYTGLVLVTGLLFLQYSGVLEMIVSVTGN